nr:hypothetical protein CFP56_70048 [Quercus suber]
MRDYMVIQLSKSELTLLENILRLTSLLNGASLDRSARLESQNMKRWHSKMFRRLLQIFHTTPLKNTGSVARDLLASERTFLAWARTGLGFIALGVALEKVEALAAIAPTLIHLQGSRTKVAAGVLVASGSVCVAHGTIRYFSTMRMLQRGLFQPNVPGVVGVAAVSLGIAFAGTLLVLQNESGEQQKGLQHKASASGSNRINDSSLTLRESSRYSSVKPSRDNAFRIADMQPHMVTLMGMIAIPLLAQSTLILTRCPYRLILQSFHPRAPNATKKQNTPSRKSPHDHESHPQEKLDFHIRQP